MKFTKLVKADKIKINEDALFLQIQELKKLKEDVEMMLNEYESLLKDIDNTEFYDSNLNKLESRKEYQKVEELSKLREKFINILS